MKLRHKKHRYSGQRRVNQKRRKITALIVTIIMVLVAIGSVFLGLYLKDKVESTAYPEDTFHDLSQKLPDTSAELTAGLDNDFYAGYFSIKGLTEGNASKIIRRIIEEDGEKFGDAVAIKFNDAYGKPLFSSEVAKALSLQDSDCDLPTIETVVSEFSEAEISVTVIFNITAGDYTDEALDAVLSYEAALIKELYSGGVAEVILFYDEKEDVDYSAVLKALAGIIRTDSFSEKLGVILSYKELSADDASLRLKELSSYFDIIVSNFTDIEALEGTDEIAPVSASDITKERITDINYLFTRYNLRVLVDAKSSFCDEIASAALEASPCGIINIELEYKFPQQVRE